MATITVETIEKLNIASVLQALEQERKAQKALENVVWATNASKKESVKVIGAQIRALQKENDEIEAITAKWEAARAAERGYEIAAQGAGAASKDVSAGLRGLSFQLNDVVTGLASGQKPMQIFAQQGGQIFQAFQQTPGLLAGVASGLGTVGAGVAALAAPLGSVLIPLWLDYSQAQDQATASLEAWNEAEAATLPLLDKATKDVERLVELTEGSLTLDQTKAKIARQYNEQLEAANRPLKDRIAILEEEERTLAKTDSRYKMVILELREKKRQIEENNDAAAKGAVASALVAEFAYEEAESERVLAERKKASTDARKAAKDAAKEEAEALKELLFLQGIDDKIEALDASDLFDTQSMWDVVETFEEAQLRMAKAAEKRAQAVANLEALQKAQEKKDLTNAQTLLGATTSLYEDMYERKAALAEDGTEQQKQDALKAWQIQHRLALAEAVTNAVLASSAALATPPAPNVFAAAAAAALGAVPVANIASQQAPTFSDTPAGGYRFGGGAGNTIEGAQNDTAILFREPLEGVRQALNVLASRQAPTTTPATGNRSLIGPSLARDPVTRMLTQDVGRVTRGWIMPRSF